MNLAPYPIPAGAVTPCMDDPELHFPDRNASVRADRAKTVCNSGNKGAPCDYRDSCLAWALTRGEEGVWGGTDENERRRMCNARGIVPVRPQFDLPRGIRNLIPHGTAVGVEAHKKRYQPLCDECTAFDEGRYANTGRVACDCGKKLLPSSMRKHKRMHCTGGRGRRMTLLDRISRAVDSAIEAVIGAVIDHVFREWAEETARAAKEESCPWNGCASCTSVDDA